MSESRSVARSAGTVGAATMLSRVLGLVREQVMAGFFGAGFATDAFNVAFRIPNLLRDLFAEGAMSAAFVPTFTEVHAKQGSEAAWALGRQVMGALTVALSLVVVLGFLFAPWIVTAFAPGFGEMAGKIDLTVMLTRVMLPFLPAVALGAACMGMLNARGVFAVPALAPSLLNACMIVLGVGLIPVCEHLGQPGILAMAIGVLVGGFAQFLFQLPALARLGFRLGCERPLFSPGVRRVASLMLPATVGLAATQFNLLVTTIIASMLEEGSVSWLWYAYRLMQLPIGVFGVALATVSLPALSRAAVAEDWAGLRRTLTASVRLVLVLTVPAAIWLAVTARPIIALLYEHGRFSVLDTDRTAAALVMYCIGLPAFAAVGILARAFFAVGDTRTPVRVSFLAVALNLVLNLLLMKPLGHVGMALATSATSMFSLAQLLWLARARFGGLGLGGVAAMLLRVVAVSGVAGAAIALGLVAVGERCHGGLLPELLTVGSTFLVGFAVLYAGLRILRVDELATLVDLARGMLARMAGRRG